VSLSDKVPAEAKAKVDEVKAGLRARTYAIWKGPIVDQSGKTVIETGATADDPFLLGINFFVKGVEGTLPATK
jgi:simple sugar transport system substrate-binding protein